MKIKRILAALLCFTMIMTSGAFTSVAYAEELTEGEIVLIDDAEEDVVVPEVGISEDELSEDELSEGNALDVELEADDINLTDESSSTEEGEIDLEIEGESISEEELSLVEETVEEEFEEDDDLILQATLDYFEVDSNGVFDWKAEYKNDEDRFSKISNVKILEGTKKIADGVFRNDGELNSVDFSGVGETLETIGEYAFYGCTSLTDSFTAPENLKYINDYAFSGCSMNSASLNGVISIGVEAFKKSGVTYISAPSCETVGDSAFLECSNLTEIFFPAVEEIGKSAFSACSKLSKVNLTSAANASTISAVGENSFSSTAVEEIDWSGYSFDQDKIGNGVFANCTKLQKIQMPSVNMVPINMCSECSSLTEIIFHQDNKIIGSGAFSNCKKLSKVVTSASIYKINATAFSGDTALKTVDIEYVKDTTHTDSLEINMKAFPDLAKPSALKMRGYIDEVHNYADQKGYTWESLYEVRDIKIASIPGRSAYGCEAVLSLKKARRGDVVTITFTTSDSNYMLDDFRIVTSDNISCKAELKSSTKYASVFQFVMPELKQSNGYVSVQYATKGIKSIKEDINISKFNTSKDGGYPTGGSGSFKVDTVGRAFTIEYSPSSDSYVDNRNWMWLFSSSNSKVVRVDELGNVTATGEGEAIITATLKTTETKYELRFSVGNDQHKIMYAAIEPKIPDRASYDTLKENPGEPNERDIPIIYIDKAYIEKNPVTFEAKIVCKDDQNKTWTATPSYWATVDSKIAQIAGKESYSNSMKVTVPKGAIGETMVTAYALNPGEKKVNADSPNEDNLGKMIIRVVDATPRLINSSFTVDYNSSIGTKLDLVEVYGPMGKVAQEGNPPLRMVQKKTENGEVKYKSLEEIGQRGIVFYYNENNIDPSKSGFYAKKDDALNLKSDKSVNYKNMYLEGTYDNSTTKFYIPLGNVTLTNKPLKPTISYKGKINTFYGKDYDESLENRSFITATQSIKNIEIESISLCDSLHYNSPGDTTKEDLFKKNFKVVLDKNDNTKFYIYMNDELDELETDDKGKAVTSGYIKIKYKGYTNTVDRTISVSCGDTTPSYVLSSTSGSLNYFSYNQQVELYLYKKGDSKKTPIDLSDMDVSFDNSKTTTGKTFKSEISLEKRLPEDEFSKNLMVLKQDNTQDIKAGKAVISIHHPSWAGGKSIKYTYSVSVTKSDPSAKFFGSSSVNLNKKTPNIKTDIYIYSSQDSVPISNRANDLTNMLKDTTDLPSDSSGIKYTGNAKNLQMKAAALNMISAMKKEVIKESTTGKTMLHIEISLPSDTPKGSYSFKIWPVVDYNPDPTGTGDSQLIKPVAFKVNVADTKVTLSVGSNFVFNKECFRYNDQNVGDGLETYINKYTLKNLPSGKKQRDFKVDISDANISPTNTKARSFYDIVDLANFKFYADDDEDVNICYTSLKIKNIKKREDPFSWTYVVSGAKLILDGKEVTTIADFKVTIQTKNTASSLSVKQSGSINMVDCLNTVSPSCATFTAKPNNFVTNDLSVVLKEIHDNGDEKESTEYFQITQDPDDKLKAYVTLIQGANISKIVPGKKYRVNLEYTIPEKDNKIYVYPFDIVVKQTFPGISSKQDISKIYAGQANRTITVTVKPKKDSDLALLTGVDFKNGKDDSYYQAFAISDFTSHQEVDGYGNDLYVDITTANKPLKMYKTHDANGAAVLKYVDTKVTRIVYFDNTDGLAYYWKYDDKPHNTTDNEKIKIAYKRDSYFTFKLTLKNAAALTLNKKHNVSMVCQFKNQADNTKGTAFTVSVDVNK